MTQGIYDTINMKFIGGLKIKSKEGSVKRESKINPKSRIICYTNKTM